jgi:hypothetical protein
VRRERESVLYVIRKNSTATRQTTSRRATAQRVTLSLSAPNGAISAIKRKRGALWRYGSDTVARINSLLG